MKLFIVGKTIIVLAVVAVTVAGGINVVQAQPVPAPASSALPADIVPGSPLADVVKMVQAGVEVATIQSYIANSQSMFNLDADKILFLKDEGVPSELINAMLDRDKILYASTVTPVVPPPAPPAPAPTVDTSTPDMAPPPEEVTVNYFYDTLSPYGTWVDIAGYGQCWRPTAVIYDPSWHPYGDRGHWIYTDYGWYWDSDYAWGVAFHYGRWFRSPQYGWCWYPDTVWAPSWVTWRSGGDYCGWAPLPPFAVFTPGVGFYYRGVRVGMDFDFGLGADYFMFVGTDHFCDRRPSNYFVKQQYVTQIYHQTTVINNYNLSGKAIVNRGIAVERISGATHQTITPVHVSALANAGQQGWRGAGYQQTLQRNAGQNHTVYNAGGSVSTRNGQLGGSGNTVHYSNQGQTTTPGSQTGNRTVGTTHPQYQYPQQQQQQSFQPQHPQSFQSQPQTSYPQQSQTRSYNSYAEPNHVASQTPSYEGQQTHNYGSSASVGTPQHGSGQLQPSQNAAPQPSYNDSGSRGYNQAGSSGAAAQSPSPARNSSGGNGVSGGPVNGANNGRNNGSNKQNQ